MNVSGSALMVLNLCLLIQNGLNLKLVRSFPELSSDTHASSRRFRLLVLSLKSMKPRSRPLR